MLKSKISHPNWVEIDLEAIEHNINQVNNKLTAGTEIIAIVKANAYGHGLIPVAKTAVNEGVEKLGVATIEEGKNVSNRTVAMLGVLLIQRRESPA